MIKKTLPNKSVEAIVHEEAKRKNIPTAEHQSVIKKDQGAPLEVRYPRNTDLDPQLVWRGKDEQDWSELIVHAPPLYIQEKVHPKALVDELLRETKEQENNAGQSTADLFSDFDGLPKEVDKTEFYSHDQNWSNRMILGDSLQVMASLAEREGLRGAVQCIYIDPPYGIKFNSNFQWSTTSRDVKDGEAGHITREPEQVKAFRDTWRDGIHSYLTYLRDRLTVARDLLSDTGSIFVQIGDENVHRVRSLMEEVFGHSNFISEIIYRTNSPLGEDFLPKTTDYILWFAKNRDIAKYRQLFLPKTIGEGGLFNYLEEPSGLRRSLTSEEKKDLTKAPKGSRFYFYNQLSSSGYTRSCFYDIEFQGKTIPALKNSWKTHKDGMENLIRANRIIRPGKLPYMVGYHDDFPVKSLSGNWDDTRSAMGKTYVVETQDLVIQRCILMATDPGDLVLDPTCGSGTTAFVCEQWGRRWITIDTSRVALALARARIMGSKYPYYLLADSRDGQIKEGQISSTPPKSSAVKGNIKFGFVYERVPHITLKSVANNTEIAVIWEKWKRDIDAALEKLNSLLGEKLNEWDVPFEPKAEWNEKVRAAHSEYLKLISAKKDEINQSIASHAEYEYLYDKPYEDKKKVRVAGPFTVESLSPHRMLGVDEDDNLIDPSKNLTADEGHKQTFEQMILENLKTAGVQQANKEDRIIFSSLNPWPGNLICAEGSYREESGGDSSDKRAAIFIGPEFGTVQRADLVEAAKEAGDAGFDSLIACAFNYEAHATEFSKLGRIPVLKARMNADLHMAKDLKNTGKGNLFVVFGEPDIEILQGPNEKIRVKVNGVDVFKPQTGEVVSDGADGIACWFIDTDYDEESFFVRQAYFLGADDPYDSLKKSLKAEINAEAWSSLNSDTSRAFAKPKSGRIAVKVINHLGDEVMKVFKV